ncbi:Vacuolar protein sorting-associated protein 41 [Gonapodya sp. JEL0774]|nr:Vacuolar protein sorting-associated protein 41 [Gonapodya sp. JEL0774]
MSSVSDSSPNIFVSAIDASSVHIPPPPAPPGPTAPVATPAGSTSPTLPRPEYPDLVVQHNHIQIKRTKSRRATANSLTYASLAPLGLVTESSSPQEVPPSVDDHTDVDAPASTYRQTHADDDLEIADFPEASVPTYFPDSTGIQNAAAFSDLDPASGTPSGEVMSSPPADPADRDEVRPDRLQDRDVDDHDEDDEEENDDEGSVTDSILDALQQSSESGSEDLDDQEPRLKYHRLGGALSGLLKKDMVSCMAVSDKFVALGTHWGSVHILDPSGNAIKHFSCHTATVNEISLDRAMEFVASASDDGRVVVNSLYAAETTPLVFKRPIKAVAIEPNFAKSTVRQVLSGGMAEQVNLSGKGWFGNSTVVVHQGEGPIYTVKWNVYMAWANDQGIRVHDPRKSADRGLLLRPENSPRPDLFRCNLMWKSDNELLVGWADAVTVARVPEGPGSEGDKKIEIIHSFRTEYVICGIAPLLSTTTSDPPLLVLLAYRIDKSELATVDSIMDPSAESSLIGKTRRKLAKPPEVRVVELDGEEVANDGLSVHGYEYYQANDYRLDFLPSESTYYLLSPKDVVMARPRDLSDHIEWLLERQRYEEALAAAEAAGEEYSGRVAVHDIVDIGQKYLGTLTADGRYAEAAAACPKILRSDTALWEKWVYTFRDSKQLPALVPFLPTGTPQLRAQVYEMVLVQLLARDYMIFLETVRKWPATLYNVQAIIAAAEERRHEVSPPSDVLILQALAHLYAANKSYDMSFYYHLILKTPNCIEMVTRYNLFPSLPGKMSLMFEYDEFMLTHDETSAKILSDVATEMGIHSEPNSRTPTLPRPGAEVSIQSSAAMLNTPTLAPIFPSLVHVRTLMRSPTVTLLVANTDRVAPGIVVNELREHNQSKYLFVYLERLWRTDPSSPDVATYADMLVELFAEYDPARLMEFLKGGRVPASEEPLDDDGNSDYANSDKVDGEGGVRETEKTYDLRRAYVVCEARRMVPEMVYLLGKMGDNKRALKLIIGGLGDIRKAIDFAKDQNDGDLWEDLINYSMSNPGFIVILLENINAHIDPIKIIKRIEDGMQIPGLKRALVKVLEDYGVQASLREGCEKILLSDTIGLLEQLYFAQRRAMSFETEVVCAMCSLPVAGTSETSAAVLFFCRHWFHERCLSSNLNIQDLAPALEQSYMAVDHTLSVEKRIRLVYLADDKAGLVSPLFVEDGVDDFAGDLGGASRTGGSSRVRKRLIRDRRLFCPLCSTRSLRTSAKESRPFFVTGSSLRDEPLSYKSRARINTRIPQHPLPRASHSTLDAELVLALELRSMTTLDRWLGKSKIANSPAEPEPKRQKVSISGASPVNTRRATLSFGPLGFENQIPLSLATVVASESILGFLSKHPEEKFDLIFFHGDAALVDEFSQAWSKVRKSQNSDESRMRFITTDIPPLGSIPVAEVTWRYKPNTALSRQIFATRRVTHDFFNGRTIATGVATSLQTEQQPSEMILVKVPNMNPEKPDALVDLRMVEEQLMKSWEAAFREFYRLFRGGVPSFGCLDLLGVQFYDDQLVVVEDKFPKAKKHLLVIPRKHIEGINDLTRTDLPLLQKMKMRADLVARE